MGRGRRSLVAAGALAIAVAILGLGFTPDVFAAGPSTVHIVHGRLGTPRIVVAAHLAKSAHPRLNRRFLTDDPVSFARGKADAASGHGGRRTGVVNLETSGINARQASSSTQAKSGAATNAAPVQPAPAPAPAPAQKHAAASLGSLFADKLKSALKGDS